MVLFRNSVRVFSRYIRSPVHIAGVKTVSGATVLKEEVNKTLLTAINRDIEAGGAVPVFRRALLFPSRVALQDEFGIYTYAGLHQAAAELSMEISTQLVGETERTICYMCSNDASHIIVQWAIWMSGNIAVPLTPIHPPEMLKYFITDSASSLIISAKGYENVLRPISVETKVPVVVVDRDKEINAQLYQPNNAFMKPKSESEESLKDVGKSNAWYGDNDALIIYTSGTTSKPKGVVWTHSMLQTHIASLHSAWQYSANDVVLHTLPLHHIHGQLNSMLASLAAGARIRMLPSFVAHTVWARLLGMGERDETKVTVFHGVPAMYTRLVADYEKMFNSSRTAQYVRSTLGSRMRLMVAGSAPLPDTLFKRWEEISGLRLLERYGMSEVGMALSNPYLPAEKRTVGCVGLPLPGMSARIAAAREDSEELEPLVTVESPMADVKINLNRLSIMTQDSLTDSKDSGWREPKITIHKELNTDHFQGELLLKGPGVFSRYLNRLPELTSEDFTPDGWFRTGDTALFSGNVFKILGRSSVDIIKTGGYKVSALQVESAILEHPNVADVAVVGIENDEYGEIVGTVVVLKEKGKLTLQELKDDAGKRLAPYQLPKTLLVIDEMPRNAMGKLDKKVIKNLYGKALILKK